MSLSVEEREQWKREIDRLNAQGWAEDKRQRVQAIQAANPGMSFERAWDQAEREEQSPPVAPTSIGQAARLVRSQHSDWPWERCWHHAEAVYPDLIKNSTAEESRVAASQPPHLERREKWQVQARIEAEARALMARDPRLTMGAALTRARSEAPLAQIAHAQTVPAVEPKPKGRTLLIRGTEATYVD